MQSLEWTTELIITASVAGLVLAVLGYLLAMVLLLLSLRSIVPILFG